MRHGHAWLCLWGVIGLLGAASGARAGTDVIVHDFGAPGSGDGTSPEAGVISVRGILYGTTASGGEYGGGTVYSFDPSGQYKVLHSFPASKGYGGPVAGLTYKGGVFYGTTIGGGARQSGTVFSITARGAYRLIHSFSGPDGSGPEAPVINYGGTLYGTASAGGAFNEGTIYGIPPDGKVRVLHSFSGYMAETNSFDGMYPQSALTPVEGSFFGTAPQGGFDDAGVIFAVTPSGQYSVVHAFDRGRSVPATGFNPYGGLVAVNGNLYGTTVGSTVKGTDGAIFAFDPEGGKESPLKYFRAGDFNGYDPLRGLSYYKGLFYGTTAYTLGGKLQGNVFSVDASGHGRTIYRFRGGTDGANPVSNVSHVGGDLYVTTSGGGAYGAGTIAIIKP